MGALLVRKRTSEVIKEYESLSASGEVPNYAKRWVASAWLSERQPEKTEAMLMSIYYPNGLIPVTPLSILRISRICSTPILITKTLMLLKNRSKT